jgi:hypothetical protein
MKYLKSLVILSTLALAFSGCGAFDKGGDEGGAEGPRKISTPALIAGEPRR